MQQWRYGGILTVLTLAPGCASAEPLLTDKVFAPTSFWYTPLPVNAPLHPNSANFVKDFLRQKNTYYNTVNINTRDYTSPVFIAEASTPKTRVTQWDCQKKGYSDKGLAEQWAAVPIPAYAMPSKGTDAEMTIYQPSTDTLWEFWQTRKIDGAWQACWGGRMTSVSKNDGIFPNHYGTTATSLPFIGGQITPEELKRGEIRHAIGISLVETEHFNVLSYPASRSDGWNPNKLPHRIPEGLRLRLDPKVNVDALPMSKAGKTIAKAAQIYGFVVWDKAGAISIRAQNAYTYIAQGQPDPYPALFGNKPNYAVLDGFPWEKLQFMPMNYRPSSKTPGAAVVPTQKAAPKPATAAPAKKKPAPPPKPQPQKQPWQPIPGLR